MMHNDRRPHVQKRREKLRERQAGPVQPGPGGSVGGATSGVGRPASSTGDQHGGVNQVAPNRQAEDTVRIQPGAITERQIRAWKEAADAVPPTRPQRESLGQRNRDVQKLTVKQRLARWAGTKAGRAMARRAEDSKVSEQNGEQKLAIATTAGKGVKQAIISVTTLVAVLGLIRGFAPDLLWPPEQDAEMAAKLNEALASIAGAVGAVAFLVGVIKNLFKNRSLAKNGVSVTKVAVVLLAMGLMSGCAFTTPEGVWSIGIDTDMLGAVKDNAQALANTYQEIEAQEAALEEAQKAGKTDRVASILEKIANLRQKAENKESVVQEEIEAAQEVLAESPS